MHELAGRGWMGAGVTRRSALAGGAALLASAPTTGRPGSDAGVYDTVVVGAGVFGAWTATRLLASGQRVLLIDAWAPGHARASSGGESRLTRAAYGGDELYTRMAVSSLVDWRRLSATAALPLFHQTGVLFFYPEETVAVRNDLALHARLGLPTRAMNAAAMSAAFPQMNFSGIAIGIYEPSFGALMARRAVGTLVAQFVAAGGAYVRASVKPPVARSGRLDRVSVGDGRAYVADSFVFACGAWLPRLFPQAIASRIVPTRQEVFFFSPPAGDARFSPGALPGWAEDAGPTFYGFPDLEGRGFKISRDMHGPVMNPDEGDRLPSPDRLNEARSYMAKRFPGLAGAPLSEGRVCQYENSATGDFLIDVHPTFGNVVLVGAGSGHGFKHGPAVGRYAADLAMGVLGRVEPRFSLAAKIEMRS